MEFKGTKGNWEVDSDNNDYFNIRTENDIICSSIIFDETLEEQLENAKLIAAAPELLNALQELGKLIDDGDLVRDISNDDDSHYFTMQGLRITKAIGKYQKAINKALK